MLVSEVSRTMPKATLDILDKVLIKCMDFSEFLNTFTEDLKIEDLHKSENSTKTETRHFLWFSHL